MLTRKTTYALRALSHLARIPGHALLTAEIAAVEGIPPRFLQVILRQLTRHGVLYGKRGRGGGYALRRGAETITIASIVAILDGPIFPFRCLESATLRCEECPGLGSCAGHLVLDAVSRVTRETLERLTLADVVGRMHARDRETVQLTRLRVSSAGEPA